MSCRPNCSYVVFVLLCFSCAREHLVVCAAYSETVLLLHWTSNLGHSQSPIHLQAAQIPFYDISTIYLMFAVALQSLFQIEIIYLLFQIKRTKEEKILL